MAALDRKLHRGWLTACQEVNRKRLAYTRRQLGQEQQMVFDLLPLLLQVNDEALPGHTFRGSQAPAGFAGYDPGGDQLNALKKLCPKYRYRHRASRSYPLLALYAMGSVGSIAFSSSSDLDLWLCYDSSLNANELEILQDKCIEIERWAEGMGVEVHFFLMNDERFRAGQGLDLSSESSGSAQHHFLLDEFYRTSLLLVGRFPLWWLVPEEEEGNYDAYARRLLDERVVEPYEVLDFGGLGQVPVEEFYGASVWQVYKGIGSPYKSVLKILLMEAYTSDYPRLRMLALEFKRLVMGGSVDLTELDPYLILMQRLGEYLLESEDIERIEIARRCFYFKANVRLSQGEAGFLDKDRYILLSGLMASWGWFRPDLINLDTRSEWKVERVLEERSKLIAVIKRSYAALSSFGRTHADSVMIDPQDLHLLGRKLYSAFDRKAGKVELINPGISNNISEERVTIFRHAGEQEAWFLYRGDANTPEARQSAGVLKRTLSLVELAAWCHFNGIVGHSTVVSLYSARGVVDQKQLDKVFELLRSRFPDGQFSEPAMAEYLNNERPTEELLILNAGAVEQGLSSAIQMASSSDVFNYFGSEERSLLRSIDLLVINNWHEIVVHHLVGDLALPDLAALWVRINRGGGQTWRTTPVAHCNSYIEGTTIARRVSETLQSIVHHASRLGAGEQLRYIMRIGGVYHMLRVTSTETGSETIGDEQSLLAALSGASDYSNQTLFDQSAATQSPLPTLYAHHTHGTVSLYYRPFGNQVDIFIIDERGALFQQRQEWLDPQTLIVQFHRFFTSVFARREPGSHAGPPPRVEYLEFGRSAKRWVVRMQTIDPARKQQRYFNVQVIGERTGSGGNRFTIFCDDREFSSLEHGGDLFLVIARHVLDRRKMGERYPIYITDIDISRMVESVGRSSLQTIHYLSYKARIEERLNVALMSI
jgi:adenylate cyclase class 1